MPPIVKSLLIAAVVMVAIIIGFGSHWAIGTGMVLLLIGYGIFISRSALYAQRGNLAHMKGDREKALDLLERAYRTKPVDPKHMIGYGYLLLKAGQLDRAEQVLGEALAAAKVQDVRMQAKINMATAYWLQNRKDEALSLLEDVHREYKNTMVYGNLGYFKLLRGELEEALAYNQEAYEYNDSDMTIMDNLAQNLYLLGRLDEAADMYAKVIGKSPKHADSYYYYALTLQKLGRTEEARKQAGLAMEKELALVTPLTREDVKRLIS